MIHFPFTVCVSFSLRDPCPYFSFFNLEFIIHRLYICIMFSINVVVKIDDYKISFLKLCSGKDTLQITRVDCNIIKHFFMYFSETRINTFDDLRDIPSSHFLNSRNCFESNIIFIFVQVQRRWFNALWPWTEKKEQENSM